MRQQRAAGEQVLVGAGLQMVSFAGRKRVRLPCRDTARHECRRGAEGWGQEQRPTVNVRVLLAHPRPKTVVHGYAACGDLASCHIDDLCARPRLFARTVGHVRAAVVYAILLISVAVTLRCARSGNNEWPMSAGCVDVQYKRKREARCPGGRTGNARKAAATHRARSRRNPPAGQRGASCVAGDFVTADLRTPDCTP